MFKRVEDYTYAADLVTPEDRNLSHSRMYHTQNTDQEGNAFVIANLYRMEILFHDQLGWLHWNTRFWEQDPHAVRRIVVDTLRQRERFYRQKEPRIGGKDFAANMGNVNGILSFLEDYTRIDMDQFDRYHDLLPVENGIVDLSTGTLEKHDSTKQFTFTATIGYNKEATYTEWEHFLRGCVNGDEEALEALQIYSGYMLTGQTKEEKMLYISGPPRSGKGTYTETMKSLLPYPIAQEKDYNTFTAKREGDTNNFDLASLRNARMVFASESQRYQTLNAAKIKAMTGGNDINAAFKFKDGFSFRPKFKLCLTSNFDVNADVDDDAVWSRLLVVQFPHSHLDQENTNLKATFRTREMREGILKWAIEGAVKWYQRGGLLIPESFRKNLREQRTRLDSVAQWLEECTIRNETAFTPNVEARLSYQQWCKENGIEPKQDRAFSLSLENKGFRLDRQRAPKFNTETRAYEGEKQQRGIVGFQLIS